MTERFVRPGYILIACIFKIIFWNPQDRHQVERDLVGLSRANLLMELLGNILGNVFNPSCHQFDLFTLHALYLQLCCHRLPV